MTATLPSLSDTRVLLPVIDCPECVWSDFGAPGLDFDFVREWSTVLHAAGADLVREPLRLAWLRRGYNVEFVCHHRHAVLGDPPVEVELLHEVAQEAVGAIEPGLLLARADLEAEYADYMGRER